MIEDQALDRVYRIGQKKEVTTTRYIVNGTLEDVCLEDCYYPGKLKLIEAQSIRAQQSEKRNLAEQAFTMSQRQGDWVSVSNCMNIFLLSSSNSSDQQIRASLSNAQ